MQRLIPINVGQQANDRSGDPLRDGMAKVNENFAKVTTAMDAVETAVAQTSALAGSARDIAAAALPAVQKNRPGGVAPLDADGKVPAGNLPDSVPMSQKGAAGGVAPLDAAGKVPAGHLPDSIPMSQKGAADGVTPLDAAGKVPVAHLPKLDYLPVIQRGAPDGVAPLDAQGKVPAANLPAAEDAIPLAQKGQPNGVAALAADGKVPAAQLPPIESIPTGFVAWAPKRGAIWAGWIPGDGQLVSRATFPDLAAAVADGVVPVVSEAEWLADPLKRGAYTLGDGATSIRVPDYNGKAAGALGAPVLRGDGVLSAGNSGVIQRDAIQNILGYAPNIFGYADSQDPGTGALRKTDSVSSSVGGSSVALQLSHVRFDASLAARTATETRMTNVTGCYVIKAFSAVAHHGAANVAQLASDLAALNAVVQSLNGQLDFTIVYPNGGSAAAPAPVAVNSVYVLPNPFPGNHVMCTAQLRYTDGWVETGWYTDDASANRSAGTRAGQLNGGDILVRTGNVDIWPALSLGGAASQGTLIRPVQSRVLVWKLKGGVA